MSLESALGLIAFVVATSATPGPNTMMLLASGMNFGFRRSLPHMLGISVGFGSLLVAVAAGLGAALKAAPRLELALKVASVAYMLWLAWRIATAAPGNTAQARGRPLSLLDAALFQLVNPKAWAIAIAGAAAYVRPEAFLASLAIMVGAFVALNLPIAAAWTAFGVGLQTFLAEPARAKWFNRLMAVLLIASLAPLVAEIFHAVARWKP